MPRRTKKIVEENNENLAIGDPAPVLKDYGNECPIQIEIPITTNEKKHLETLGLYQIGKIGKRYDEDGNQILCVTLLSKHT